MLIDRDAGAALVTAMIPDQPTRANLDLIAAIEADLADLAAAARGFHFEITGLVALTALETGRIITSLQIGLFAAVVVIVGLIGLTFRHPWPAAINIVPNLFPITLGGAFLALRGGELNFAGAIAMTAVMASSAALQGSRTSGKQVPLRSLGIFSSTLPARVSQALDR